MNVSFKNISEFPRGILFAMLSDAYAFDHRCAQDWSNDWREFDDFFFGHLEIADQYGFVTVLNHEALGFVSWDPRSGPEYIAIGHNCIVTPYQGRGYGKIQLQEAVRRISGKYPKKIIVTTSGILLPAQRMYESVGFQKIRHRDNNHFSGELIDYEYIPHDITL